MRPTTFASDTHALLRVAGSSTIIDGGSFPTGHFRWGIAATSGAFHGFHIDSNGLGTYVRAVSGIKWWIIATPKKGIKLEDISTLLDDRFDPMVASTELFSYEAILLQPGSTLYALHHSILLLCRRSLLHQVYEA